MKTFTQFTEGSKGLRRLTRKNNSSVDIPDSQKDLDAAIEKRKPRESAFREKTKGMPVKDIKVPKKEPRVVVGGVLQQWRNYRKLKGRTSWWTNSPTPKGTRPNAPTTAIKADRKNKTNKQNIKEAKEYITEWFA